MSIHYFRIDGPLNRSVARTLRPDASPEELDWLINQAKNWDSIRQNHWVETGRWLNATPPLFREKTADDSLKPPAKKSKKASKKEQREKLRALLRDLQI